MVVQDLALPALESVVEGADLLDLVALAADDRLAQERAGLAGPLGQVDVAHRLLGQPGPEELVVGVAPTQPEQHALVAPLVEALRT